uniref:Uncharacterized protein n=1 Tax=Ditylenchus dipsaci TaxID=166011 RepID=A0A915E7A6_9BILA
MFVSPDKLANNFNQQKFLLRTGLRYSPYQYFKAHVWIKYTDFVLFLYGVSIKLMLKTKSKLVSFHF